jgi:hypothetical protein
LVALCITTHSLVIERATHQIGEGSNGGWFRGVRCEWPQVRLGEPEVHGSAGYFSNRFQDELVLSTDLGRVHQAFAQTEDQFPRWWSSLMNWIAQGAAFLSLDIVSTLPESGLNSK